MPGAQAHARFRYALCMLSGLITHPWAYPALEVVHLLGIALVLGNLALIEVRVFGLGRDLDARALARLSLGLVVVGFACVGLSGLLMFATQAQELLANRSFVIKMGLMTLALCNAAAFHARQSLQRLDGWARAQMMISSLLWLAVLAAGRWIAYD